MITKGWRTCFPSLSKTLKPIQYTVNAINVSSILPRPLDISPVTMSPLCISLQLPGKTVRDVRPCNWRFSLKHSPQKQHLATVSIYIKSQWGTALLIPLPFIAIIAIHKRARDEKMFGLGWRESGSVAWFAVFIRTLQTQKGVQHTRTWPHNELETCWSCVTLSEGWAMIENCQSSFLES